ncbi:hypothetical protein SB2_06960 [Methylobacterium radiotolerans]|nr:hypothetical protein SB3_09005 [Methylobacterium radiotolerans]KTS49282.1 hypothetical protein SB2_06960 [Methylobacterium radiotolerans]
MKIFNIFKPKRPKLPVIFTYGPERAGKTTIASCKHEAISADVDRTEHALRLLNARLRRIDQRGG